MKRIVTKLAAIAAAAVISMTGMAFADAQGLQVGLGYRQDSLKWNFRDNGLVNPRIKTQQHFKDLEIVTLGVKYKGLLGCSVYARVNYDYGWVVDGRLRDKTTVKDRDYAAHFCRGLFTDGDYATVSFNNRHKSNSYVWDLNFGVGMPLDCLCGQDFKFAPMVGFSYDRHHLKFSGNSDVYVRENESSGSFDVIVNEGGSHCFNQDSVIANSDDCSHHRRKSGHSFQTSFWGPWLGFDVSYNSQGCWNLFGEFELHFGRAERERNSHSGCNFIDNFSHTKDFWGPVARVGGNYMFCDCWYLEGTLSYLYYMSYNCHDRLYWNSAQVRFDLGYMF